MGIKGLRAALKECQLVEGHIKQFAGKTVVVDGYAWLHKGAYSCAVALCLEGEENTEAYLKFPMHQVDMMKFYGVTPIVVLDGSALPGKAGTNQARRDKRKEQMAKGKELHAAGYKAEAEKALQGAVSVTAEMARKFHACLTEAGVRCIIAPYEADAQMARMIIDGHAHAAVTEDSDLIPYGVETCIYKLDRYGNCTVVTAESLANKGKTSLDISDLTLSQRVHLCILAGCDYLASIEGIGIRKALEWMRKYRNAYAVIKAIRAKGKLTVPDGYEEAFRKAEVTFACHRVYDMSLCRVLPLSGMPEGSFFSAEELDLILGPAIPDAHAASFSERAEIDPRSMVAWPPLLKKPTPPTNAASKFVGPKSTSFAERFPTSAGAHAKSSSSPHLKKAGAASDKWKKGKAGWSNPHGDSAAKGQLQAMFGAQMERGGPKTILGVGLWGGAGVQRAQVGKGPAEGPAGRGTPKKRKIGFGGDAKSGAQDIVASIGGCYGRGQAVSSPANLSGGEICEGGGGARMTLLQAMRGGEGGGGGWDAGVGGSPAAVRSDEMMMMMPVSSDEGEEEERGMVGEQGGEGEREKEKEGRRGHEVEDIDDFDVDELELRERGAAVGVSRQRGAAVGTSVSPPEPWGVPCGVVDLRDDPPVVDLRTAAVSPKAAGSCARVQQQGEWSLAWAVSGGSRRGDAKVGAGTPPTAKKGGGRAVDRLAVPVATKGSAPSSSLSPRAYVFKMGKTAGGKGKTAGGKGKTAGGQGKGRMLSGGGGGQHRSVASFFTKT